MWLQAFEERVPPSFELLTQRKGFKRYMTPELQELVKQHAQALDAKEVAMSGILQVPKHTCCHAAPALLPKHSCGVMQDPGHVGL